MEHRASILSCVVARSPVVRSRNYSIGPCEFRACKFIAPTNNGNINAIHTSVMTKLVTNSSKLAGDGRRTWCIWRLQRNVVKARSHAKQSSICSANSERAACSLPPACLPPFHNWHSWHFAAMPGYFIRGHETNNSNPTKKEREQTVASILLR